jgi:hypothetical protein
MNSCNWSASLLHMKVTFNSRIYISSTCNFVHKHGSRQSCHSTWRHRRSKKMESVHSNTSKDSNKNGGYAILLTSKYNNHEQTCWSANECVHKSSYFIYTYLYFILIVFVLHILFPSPVVIVFRVCETLNMNDSPNLFSVSDTLNVEVPISFTSNDFIIITYVFHNKY